MYTVYCDSHQDDAFDTFFEFHRQMVQQEHLETEVSQITPHNIIEVMHRSKKQWGKWLSTQGVLHLKGQGKN